MAESKAYLKPEILAQITKLGLRAERVVEGSISGLHRSPLHGVSVEFAEYREYSPGDDLRRLDWRAYARSNRHFIKRYEEETNLRATIILDCSASMKYKGSAQAMSKFDYAATVAASMATLMIRQRDASGLVLADTEERVFLRPAATAMQQAQIIEALENAHPDRKTELGPVMRRVAEKIKQRGLVIIISDLLCDLDKVYDAIGMMQYRGHELLMVQVLDPDEIELPFGDSVLFRDIEGTEEIHAEPWAFRKAYKEAMEAFIEDIAQRCRFCGIDHLLLRTTDDMGLTLSHYLHRRQNVTGTKRGGRMSSYRGPTGGES